MRFHRSGWLSTSDLPARGFLWVALLFGAACAPPTAPGPDTVLVALDRTAYSLDPVTGQFTLRVTLTNVGTTTAHSSTCDFPGATGVNWAFQERVSGQWQTKSTPTGGCVPPTFAEFFLEPGETAEVMATGEVHGGEYRLGVYFHDPTKVWLSRWSPPFTVAP
jgi:hypothetical protein